MSTQEASHTDHQDIAPGPPEAHSFDSVTPAGWREKLRNNRVIAAGAVGIAAVSTFVTLELVGNDSQPEEGTTITRTVENPDGSIEEQRTFIPVDPEVADENNEAQEPTKEASEGTVIVGDGIELGMNIRKPFKYDEEVRDLFTQRIEKINSTPRSEIEDEEFWSQQAFVGTVIIRTTDIYGEEDYFMRLDNPIAIQMDGYLSWAAWNENTGMWAVVDIGEEKEQGDGTAIWQSTIEEDELWKSTSMTDDPLWTVASPSLDGINEDGSLSFLYYDSRERTNETHAPVFSVYKSYEKAKAGLTEPFHNGQEFMPDSVKYIHD